MTLTHISSKQSRRHALYLDLAARIGLESYCPDLKVGAVVVRNHRIISDGWNGQPPGLPNECNDDMDVTHPSVIHAEINALNKLKLAGESAMGAAVYCTHSPCINCAIELANNGINELYYLIDYKSDTGSLYLRNKGISVSKIIPKHGEYS